MFVKQAAQSASHPIDQLGTCKEYTVVVGQTMKTLPYAWHEDIQERTMQALCLIQLGIT